MSTHEADQEIGWLPLAETTGYCHIKGLANELFGGKIWVKIYLTDPIEKASTQTLGEIASLRLRPVTPDDGS